MITCVLLISRLDYLGKVFKCLNDMQKPPGTELLLIVDSIDKPLLAFVNKEIDNLNFSVIKVKYSGNIAAKNDIADRRFRISELHNLARYEIDKKCEYVYLHEDDTIAPPDTLVKLLKVFDIFEDCGFAQGIELGRHKSQYCGAWAVDNLDKPHTIASVMPVYDGAKPLDVYERIDAGGLYCALVKAELYYNHYFEPFDKQGKNGLSCDLNFGLWIRRKEYSCILDWSIQCDHIGDKGSVNLGNTRPVQVVFEKTRDKWFGRTIA